MGIRDIAKKVLKRTSDEEEDPFSDLDDDFEEDLSGPNPVPKEEASKKANPPAEKKLKEPNEFKEKEESFEKPSSKEAPEPKEDLSRSLRNLGERLQILETKLDQIQSKEDLQKTESDRVVQYLSLINQKLDNLEKEHSELERLVQER
ncbi:MAG: hypothetical protein R6U26_00800 [Candidatus Undinarchaeales archaeon]